MNDGILSREIGENEPRWWTEDAPLTFLVYIDIQCPHCKQAIALLRELKNYIGDQYALVFRHFPLRSIHAHAQIAAEAVEAAIAQGKSEEFTSHLLANQHALNKKSLIKYAEELKLDVDKFGSDLESRKYKEKVDRDYQSGVESGVTGTPTFFINGVRYDGPWDVESLLAEIQKPIGFQVRNAFQRFASIQAIGGILLIAATIIAMFLANSPWSDEYFHFWETEIAIHVGGWIMSEHLGEWVNDGLMAIFFLVVGLEIKRAITVGELSSPQQAAFPIMAALGGMVVPVIIFLLFNTGKEAAVGWAIPMATDIAFVLGVLILLGPRVPLELRIYFSALAIVDDLGAVIILAVFYSEAIIWSALALTGVFIAALVGVNRLGVRRPLPYAIIGILLWLAVVASGIHPAIAGFVLALSIPSRASVSGQALFSQANAVLLMAGATSATENEEVLHNREQNVARTLEMITERIQQPAQRLEHALTPWSTFLIMPIFALANAGVILNTDVISEIGSPLSLGIILGLVLGKGLGVSLFSWGAVQLGIAQKPTSVAWSQLFGASWLAGIGFTMSLFIGGNAFAGTPLFATAQLSILLASVVAGFIGILMIYATNKVRVRRSI